jgi:hypothetical protein
VSLNIKDRETHELVKELADLQGTSLTAAVKDAVSQALEREKGQQNGAGQDKRKRSEILMEFAREYASRVKPEDVIHSWDIDKLLYDENGLSK